MAAFFLGLGRRCASVHNFHNGGGNPRGLSLYKSNGSDGMMGIRVLHGVACSFITSFLPFPKA